MVVKSLLRKKLKRTVWKCFLLCSGFVCKIVFKRDLVHLLHIRKTGGTAIKETMSNLPSIIKWKTQYFTFVVPKNQRFCCFLHRHFTTLKDIPRGHKVVFFVRDPISRFVSGFYDRKRQGLPRYESPWSPSEEEAFKLFDTPNKLAKALSSCDSSLRSAAIKAMRSIRHVNTHYRDWVISEKYLLTRKRDVFFIGRQESLQQDFEILKALLGIKSDETKLPDDPVKAHRSPPGHDRTLEPEAIKNLQQWFREDYELYKALLGLRAEILTRYGIEEEGSG